MAILTIIAAYDVREDARRARLAAMLQSYGDRIQKSVFLLRVEPESLEVLNVRAAGIIDTAVDSLYFMRQCGTCWKSLDLHGQAHPPEPVMFWAVL